MPSPAHQHHKLGLDLDGGSSSSACSSYEYSASSDHHRQQLQHSLPHSRCCTPEQHTRGSPMSSSSSSMLLLRPTVVQLPPLHNNNRDDDDDGGGYWGTDCEEQPHSLPATITTTTTSPRLRKLSGWSATRPEEDETETLESASVPLQWKPARRFYIKSVLWMVAMAMLTTQPNNNKASMITRPEVPRFLKQRHSASKAAATSSSLNVRHHEDWPRYEMPQAVVPTKKRANVAFARSAPERPVYHTIPRFVLEEEEDVVLPRHHNNPSVRFWIAGLVLGGMLADSLVREYHRWRAIQEEERAL